MASLNVFEPTFLFGIIIFLTHKPISKTNLRYFYVRFFYSALNSVSTTNKGQPKDKFVFSFLLESRGEEDQDAPTYTHLKCKN